MFERVKCQAVSPARVHTSLGLGGCTFKYGKDSWLDGKEKSVRIAGTEFYVISYAGLVFGNIIVYSI